MGKSITDVPPAYGMNADPIAPDIDRMATLIEEHLKSAFLDDPSEWSDRWREARYFVVYRIGDVQETFSFVPGEVAESIESAAVQWLMLPPMDVSEAVEKMRRYYVGAAEYFVRYKHRLPIVHDLLTADRKRLVRSLVRNDPSRWTEGEEFIWSLMVFAFVTRLLSQPAGANCLIVDDVRVNADDLEAAVWNPAYDAKDVRRLRADAIKFGGREYSSTRINVG
jgi:hypothetical protein